ncbi:hypothetical protein EPK97_07240 [Chengkuizengella sediminis]|nr:hypothetical protein [Chengkuizengella sediminis]
MIPSRMVKGMGGAMDLVHGAKRVIVIMEHKNKYGKPKVKKECTLPLTGKGIVDLLITDLAVFEYTSKGMMLIESLNKATVKSIKEHTEADFIVHDSLNQV